MSSFDDVIKLKQSNVYGTIIGKKHEKKIDLKKVFGWLNYVEIKSNTLFGYQRWKSSKKLILMIC